MFAEQHNESSNTEQPTSLTNKPGKQRKTAMNDPNLVIIDLTVPWHIPGSSLRYALSGVERYEQDVLGLEEADEEKLFQALARAIRAVHPQPIDEDDSILVRLIFPQDLTIDELLLAEQAIS